MRRDRKVFQLLGQGIARKVVEDFGRIAPKRRVTGEKAEVGVDLSRNRVIVAGSVVSIGHQLVALTANDCRDFGVGFPIQKAINDMRASPFQFAGLKASLHGSLAFTGVGHATDRAVILGLAGFDAETYDAARAEAELARIKAEHTVSPKDLPVLRFDPKEDVIFDYGPALPGHANGLILRGLDAQGDVVTQVTYYSIGGGFVLTEAELKAGKDSDEGAPVPYPFKSAAEMVEMAATSGRSIADMKRANELSRRGAGDLDKGLARIWEVMNNCIDRGLTTEGILPGGLNVRRRAPVMGFFVCP